MYGIQGFDDGADYDRFKEFYDGLLGKVPTDDGFQAQAPELAQGLSEPVTQQMQDLSAGGSDIAQSMADTAQQLSANGSAGAKRLAQQQANQAAMQQANSGGGLLSGLLKTAANVAMANYIGGFFPKK